ncbi:MAG: TlpA disulfide reductase family protein [Saonia sp.]
MKLKNEIIVFILVLGSYNIVNSQTKDYTSLLNKNAPEWEVKGWVNSTPLKLSDLKGKVVLVRWWLETCPYCRASAPTLNEFYSEFKNDGFEVIGMYHPKPFGRKVTEEEVKEFADVKKFEFPIAIDEDWTSLSKYWPKDVPRKYTSVSFLMDKEGIIRYIHPGGSYNKQAEPYDNEQWRQDYYTLKKEINKLLK